VRLSKSQFRLKGKKEKLAESSSQADMRGERARAQATEKLTSEIGSHHPEETFADAPSSYFFFAG